MPLRDHFHPPITLRHSWDALHSMWPAMIVQQLFDLLPPDYHAAPGVHIGRGLEVDVRAHQRDDAPIASTNDGDITPQSEWAPTLTLETELLDDDAFEVFIYDAERGRQLVAAIEIVSPSNKDRPESRRAFTAKVSGLLQQQVCVSIIDLVTTRQANLYADFLASIAENDAHLEPTPPSIYAVTIRPQRRNDQRARLDVWSYPLTIGEPLPTLPIWLDVDRHVRLALEVSYQQSCRLLHID